MSSHVRSRARVRLRVLPDPFRSSSQTRPICVIPAAGGGPPPTRSWIFSVFAEMKHAHPRQNGP